MDMREALMKKLYEMISRNTYRLGAVFETESKKYFYDRGTGKVIECNNCEYDIFNKVLKGESLMDASSLENISNKEIEMFIKNIQENNLLQAPEYLSFTKMSPEYFEKRINNNLEQVILELTEKCNLRCRYCIYNEEVSQYRTYATNDMPWDIAKKALDYVAKHSGDRVAITFYGGEPLINFELLKKCVEYSKKIMKEKKLAFSFTTNLTLMTSEIATYFANLTDEVYILCSFDGPKEVQDHYRTGINKEGSFDKALQGLEYLAKAFGKRYKECIAINSVICPPFTKENYNQRKDFFDNISFLEEGIDINFSYVQSGTLLIDDEDIMNKKYLEKEKVIDDIDDWIMSLKEKDKNFYKRYMTQTLSRIHKRILTEIPTEFIGPNGCCVPGGRRLYVTVNGDFKVCEKIGNSPLIGNVVNGIDLNSIYKYYIEQYENKSLEKCADCWASGLCGICYASCYDFNGINIEKKNKLCDQQKRAILDRFVIYHDLLEKDPLLLNEIVNSEKSVADKN